MTRRKRCSRCKKLTYDWERHGGLNIVNCYECGKIMREQLRKEGVPGFTLKNDEINEKYKVKTCPTCGHTK